LLDLSRSDPNIEVIAQLLQPGQPCDDLLLFENAIVASNFARASSSCSSLVMPRLLFTRLTSLDKVPPTPAMIGHTAPLFDERHNPS
jgi:hypothetical protein